MVAEQPLIKPLVVSDRAVVVSGHPLASRAGALALEKGGNIVDAAIAVSFALGVVEPDASGIGGDGMALLYLKGMVEPVAIDYKDQVPIRATRDNPLLAAGTGDGACGREHPGRRRRPRSPVSELREQADPLERSRSRRRSTTPRAGTSSTRRCRRRLPKDGRFFEKYRASARIYLPDGKVPKAGDRFVNKDYAATLRTIAKDGADAFYRGSIARRIADDMAKNGGLITVDDLAQYRAIERRPLAGRYRDHQIYSAPPPVSTGAALIETLQILENYQPRPGATYASDADYLHYVIESWRVRDQGPRIADPALWDVNLGSHLDPAHAATLFKRIDPKKASRDRAAPPADGATRTDRPRDDGVCGGGRGRQHDCRHADVEHVGRNVLRVRRSGLPLQQPPALRRRARRAVSCRSRARRLRACRRSCSRRTGASAGVGSPRLAVGAAGNAWIPASVYDIILNVIDGGMDAQRAIEAPRFLVGRDPADPAASRVQIEDRIPRSILVDLTARGHRFQKIGRKGEVRYGYAAAAVVDVERRQVQGGAEPRRSHAAVGVTPAATTPGDRR